jgi:hypothetical protein
MTTSPPPSGPRTVRVADLLSLRTTTGTVVLPAEGRTAVALSGVDQVAWQLTAESASADAPSSLVDDESITPALRRLSALGIVHEAP